MPIAGLGKKGKINEAYERDDPTRLLGTIHDLTGIEVDHFVQVDFCAFQKIVDAVGGVAVPFEYPATDDNTGLYVPEPGCFTFTGDHALAYVRSRHYLYMDESGVWKEDPFADIGRISRQQDFVRRVLSAALDAGLNPGVAHEIVEAVRDYIVVDTNLTPGRMLEIAGILQDFEPGAMSTYQVYGESGKVGDSSVIMPKLDGTRMQSILAIFTGQAPLPEAPDEAATATTEPGAPSTSGPDDGSTGSTVEPGAVGPNENVQGIVPPEDMEC